MYNVYKATEAKLDRIITSLKGINHGIASAIETDSGITPMQIYCMLELPIDALDNLSKSVKEPSPVHTLKPKQTNRPVSACVDQL